MEHVPSALAQQQAAEAEKLANGDDVDEDEDSEEENEGGLDPEEAKTRFEEIREQLLKTERSITRYGRDGKASKQNLEELADLFKYLKLTPRQFDPLIGMVRRAVERIRAEERAIMRLCLRLAKMPRKEFIKSFPNNETDLDWVKNLIKSDASYSQGLQNQEQEIIRCQRKLVQVETESGLSIAQIKDINRRVTMGEAMARRAKKEMVEANLRLVISCLLYTSPSPRDGLLSRMPSSA